jgi:hypothetical protein
MMTRGIHRGPLQESILRGHPAENEFCTFSTTGKRPRGAAPTINRRANETKPLRGWGGACRFTVCSTILCGLRGIGCR